MGEKYKISESTTRYIFTNFDNSTKQGFHKREQYIGDLGFQRQSLIEEMTPVEPWSGEWAGRVI